MMSRLPTSGSARAMVTFLLAAAPAAMLQPTFQTLHASAPVPTGVIQLSLIGIHESGVFDEGAAEISAFDAATKRLFVINANGATVDILDLTDPTNPTPISTIDIDALFTEGDVEASPNSVAVSDGLVVVAVQRADDDGRQRAGIAAFFNTDGELIDQARVGSLPDMVTYSPNGLLAVVANEGEPNSDYTFDPEGSISIISVAKAKLALRFPALAHFLKLRPGDVRNADFRAFNSQKNALKAAGVRIYGPGASVAQDLEPEYVTVADGSLLAYVTLQENNAVAIVNLLTAKVIKIAPLGYKDWTQSGLDASDKDDAIDILPWPVFGMYQPDGIAGYRVGLHQYLVTACEGDARERIIEDENEDEIEIFVEESRVKDLDLDPTVFPDADDLQEDEEIGRLNVTNMLGDTDNDGDFDQLYTLGGRSFSIWRVNLNGSLTQVFDSADQFEQITAEILPLDFNSDNTENDSFDNRSDNKGPEPEGVTLGEVNGRTYAFIGLERIGGVMVYDITNPAAPEFVRYTTTRDFSGDPEDGTAGDLGPEGLEFVPAADSPTGKPLLIVAFEISGSVAIFEIE